MKTLGIIAEYNPFHNGHLYHLYKAKEITKADYVIAVISGNFLQRGEPAIINKWARTEMALNTGIDLVIEIPFVFSTQDANGFAFGAVKLLDVGSRDSNSGYTVYHHRNATVVLSSRYGSAPYIPNMGDVRFHVNVVSEDSIDTIVQDLQEKFRMEEKERD